MSTVLIVDDSLTVRMDLDGAFREDGFETRLCSDLAGARRALAGGSYSLVVLDVLLPDGDGLDLLQEIKAAPQHAKTPIVLLSSETEVRDRVRGLRTGADEYIGKPYDTRYLVARAREFLRRDELGAGARARPLVLIVDDSVTAREELRSALERVRLDVITAASGEEGLRIAAARRPDAVMVDGAMPGMDGAAVIRQLRSDAALRRTPCLLLTASSGDFGELRALEAGADAFVRKQDGQEIVVARLEALLRSAGPSAPVATAGVLAPKKILAVDGDAAYLHDFSERLRQEGYDVVLARSGEEALQLLAVERVDCVLLEAVLPGLSGQETCARIKEDRGLRDVPLLVVTSVDHHGAMVEAINAGADDFVAKSSDFVVLRARIHAQLRRKQFADENREAELRLEAERRAREAEEADRRKDEFLAVLSHELRNPLAPIRNSVYVLEHTDPGGEQSARARSVIRRQTEHLTRLVDDLLDVTRIARGKIELRRSRVDLREVVSRAADDFRADLKARGIAFRTVLPEESVWADADATRITQVIGNLLHNAAKFTNREGEATLSLRAGGGEAEIRVRDSGAGIDPALLPRMFEAFVQGERTLARTEGGLGLGLALVKGITELHGGTVRAESAGKGKGAEFVVTLPLRPPAPAPEPPRPQRSEGPRRVLVVDDDVDSANSLAEVLQMLGHTAEIAYDGVSAIAQAAANPPDVVLCDVGLPDMSGYEVARRLRRAGSRTQLVAVTGYAQPEDVRSAIEAGFDCHAAKPLDAAEIERLLS